MANTTNNNTNVPMADASTQTSPGPTGVSELFRMFPPQRPTRHFFSLPIEIQLMCLQFLCQHCVEASAGNKLAFCTDRIAHQRRLALCNFSLASRHCRNLVQPVLFHRPQVGETKRGGTGHLGTLLRLVRSMVVRPDLAAEVRTIVLNLRMDTYEMPLTKDERDLIKAAGDRLQIPLAGSMFPLIWTDTPISGPEPVNVNNSVRRRGFRRYAASLVVALAPNATALDILNCSGRLNFEFRSLMLSGNTELTNNLKLKRLRVEGFSDGCKRSLAETSPFFRLAPITELVVAHPRFFIRPGLAGPDDASFPVEMLASLRRLDLFDVKLTAADFKAAMQCCPKLEWLTYLDFRRFWPSQEEDPNFVPEWFPVTPREISQILSSSPIRHTLKTLMIECPRELEAEHSPGTIGSLQALTKLQFLVIGGNAISGNYTSAANPDWTPEHDASLFNLLPVGLLRLFVFNVWYREGNIPRQEIKALVDTLSEDIQRERELTGFLRPVSFGHVGLGTAYPRFNRHCTGWRGHDEPLCFFDGIQGENCPGRCARQRRRLRGACGKGTVTLHGSAMFLLPACVCSGVSPLFP